MEMNNENLFVALVFYSLRRCGLFGQNGLFHCILPVIMIVSLCKIQYLCLISGIYDRLYWWIKNSC